jgi:TP901 family phage tail tape measure protein
VFDVINQTANNFAVSTDDLQLALSKSAAAMATAGNTFEETVSLVEAGASVMQGASGTVGNGLRTIAINIANLATKQDTFVSANGKVNVALKDSQGNLRSTYAILNDLSQNWDKLTVAEQNSIAVSLAGKQNIIPSLARYKPI